MKKQKLFLDAQKKQLVKNYDLQQKEDQLCMALESLLMKVLIL